MNNALREQVFERCNGYCEKCGQSLPESWALHHRKLRSQGGKDVVENFVALHHACHNMGTNAVHLNPADAIRNGFIVPSWGDPASVSVTLSDGSNVILTQEGTYDYLERGKNGW